MNKSSYFVNLVIIAFGFLFLGSIRVEAASFSSPMLLSSIVDKVRDTEGSSIRNGTNYRLQIFSTDTSNKTPYYLYDEKRGSIFDWFWLTTDAKKSTLFQINNQGEIYANGKQMYIINCTNGNGELVRYEYDNNVPNGGLYWGWKGHNDRYGFRRIVGDKDYKYLLTSNYGGVFANFSAKTITTVSSDSPFLIAFEKA